MCEALRGLPVVSDLVELLVDERALVSAFGTELRYRSYKRLSHVGGRRDELRFFYRHSSIVAYHATAPRAIWSFVVEDLRSPDLPWHAVPNEDPAAAHPTATPQVWL